MATDQDQAGPSGSPDGVESFKPMAGNILAGFILSVMLLAGGAALIGFPLRGAYLANWRLPFDAKQGWSWLAVGIACPLGVGFLVGGVALLGYSRGLIGRRVEVDGEGFRDLSRRGAEEISWGEVALIRETLLHERPPILKGPAKLLLPKFVSASYVVSTQSGREYRFHGDSIREIRRFGEVLRGHAQRRSLPWETVEMEA